METKKANCKKMGFKLFKNAFGVFFKQLIIPLVCCFYGWSESLYLASVTIFFARCVFPASGDGRKTKRSNIMQLYVSS